MHRLFASIVSVCLIALTTCGAHAVEGDKAGEKFHDRVETLTMWRMMQALDLDTETSEKILQVRREFLSRRKELRKTLDRSYGDLRKYLDETPSEASDQKLAQTMQKIRKARTQLRTLWELQFDATAKVLPVRKQAELAVFMRDFRREIRAVLHAHGGRPHRPRFERRFDQGPGRDGPMGEQAGPPPGPPGRRMGPPRRNLLDGPRRPGQGPPERWDTPDYLDEFVGE